MWSGVTAAPLLLFQILQGTTFGNLDFFLQKSYHKFA